MKGEIKHEYPTMFDTASKHEYLLKACLCAACCGMSRKAVFGEFLFDLYWIFTEHVQLVIVIDSYRPILLSEGKLCWKSPQECSGGHIESEVYHREF